MEKFIYAADVHGDMADKAANATLFDFVKDFKPTLRICGGDAWDFRAMRRKATEAEREMSMREDYQAGMDWLKRFRPHVWLRGNHDERLWDLVRSGHGVVKDHATACTEEIERKMQRMGVQMFPYDKRSVYCVGNLKFIHGMFTGINAARQTALTYADGGEAVIAGHAHGVDDVTAAGLVRRRGIIAGCLCNLNMDYARQMVTSLRWAHGWVYGLVSRETGEFRVEQAQQIGGKWLLPTAFKSY
jgi:hypothetical protein